MASANTPEHVAHTFAKQAKRDKSDEIRLAIEDIAEDHARAFFREDAATAAYLSHQIEFRGQLRAHRFNRRGVAVTLIVRCFAVP